MGLSVVSNSDFSDGIAFSNIVAPANLQYGLRANSVSNLVDLSDNDYDVVNTGDYNTSGVLATGATGAYVDHLMNDDSFTIITTVKVTLPNLDTASHWLAGNASGAANGTGLLLRTGAGSSSDRNILLRFLQSYYSGSAYAGISLDINIADNVANAEYETEWLVIAVVFDLASKTLKLKELITGQEIARSTSDSFWSGVSADTRNSSTLVLEKFWYGCTNATSVLANETFIAEGLYFDKALSDAELTQQLAYTTAFMQSRGIEL